MSLSGVGHWFHRLPMYFRAWRMVRHIDDLPERDTAQQVKAMGDVCLYCAVNKVIPYFGKALQPFLGAVGLADSPLSWRLHDFLAGRCSDDELILVARQYRIMKPGESLAGIVAMELDELENPYSKAEKKRIMKFAHEVEHRFE